MANRKYPNAVQAKKALYKAHEEYHRRAMKKFGFRFHKENDKEVIEKIESQTNKADYIRQLILQDIAKEKGE